MKVNDSMAEQKELDESTKSKIELAGLRDEFELNPKTEDMCLQTSKYYEGCKRCPRTPEAIDHCKREKMDYTLTQIKRLLQELVEHSKK